MKEWGFVKHEPSYSGMQLWCYEESVTLVAFYDEGKERRILR